MKRYTRYFLGWKMMSKNEGTWVKWVVVNKENIVRFVGTYKDAKAWIIKHKD